MDAGNVPSNGSVLILETSEEQSTTVELQTAAEMDEILDPLPTTQ